MFIKKQRVGGANVFQINLHVLESDILNMTNCCLHKMGSLSNLEWMDVLYRRQSSKKEVFLGYKMSLNICSTNSTFMKSIFEDKPS